MALHPAAAALLTWWLHADQASGRRRPVDEPLLRELPDQAADVVRRVSLISGYGGSLTNVRRQMDAAEKRDRAMTDLKRLGRDYAVLGAYIRLLEAGDVEAASRELGSNVGFYSPAWIAGSTAIQEVLEAVRNAPTGGVKPWRMPRRGLGVAWDESGIATAVMASLCTASSTERLRADASDRLSRLAEGTKASGLGLPDDILAAVRAVR